MRSKTMLIGIALGIVAITSYVVFSMFVNIPDYGVEIDAIKVQDLVEIGVVPCF